MRSHRADTAKPTIRHIPGSMYIGTGRRCSWKAWPDTGSLAIGKVHQGQSREGEHGKIQRII